MTENRKEDYYWVRLPGGWQPMWWNAVHGWWQSPHQVGTYADSDLLEISRDPIPQPPTATKPPARRSGYYWAWSKNEKKWIVLEYQEHISSHSAIPGFYFYPGEEESLSAHGETFFVISRDPIPEPNGGKQ